MKIDGKEIRNFLFARYSRVMLPGCIPVDRKERARVLDMSDQQRFIVNVQVEAFGKDHALTRLMESFPMIARSDWEFIDELLPEHDVGAMGTKLPLNPLVVAGSRRIQ